MAVQPKKRVTLSVNVNNTTYSIMAPAVTSAKGSEETNTTVTKTFDGPVPQGDDGNPHSIDISRLDYGKAKDLTAKESLILITRIIDTMKTVPGMVTIEEDYNPANESVFTYEKHYFECLVDGDDFEIKADDQTVNNLKFKAGRLEKVIGGESIKPFE